MALSKDILELMNEISLAATATVPASPGGSECSVIDMTESSQCALQLEAVFHADGTADCVFHVRSSSAGGTPSTDWDTVDYDSATLVCVAGEKVQSTLSIDPAPKYITVFAVNEDGTYAMTSVKVTQAIQEAQA